MNRHKLLFSAALLVLFSTTVATAQNDPLSWPREFTGENGGKLLLYEPQIDSWKDYSVLEGRAAVAFQRPGEDSPSLGALDFRARTDTDLESRMVRIYDLDLPSGRFSSLNEADSRRLLDLVVEVLPNEEVIALDRLLANLDRPQNSMAALELNTDPPVIFFSTTPSVLVILDGPPVWSPIERSDLKFAVNTNWDLFHHEASKAYFLRNEDSWYKATDLAESWSAAGKLPKSFKKLSKKDPNWTAVRKSLPGRKLTAREVPKVFVSETPAELISTTGEPRLSLIEGTKLLVVANTGSDLFLSSEDSHFYYLISGRWFRSESLDGDWTFATPDLPADFARIPEDHPMADVLASVPGSEEAEDAVLLAQIPQKATVEKDKVVADVSYGGEPEFKAIEDTEMSYAVNTSSDVIRVGDLYYLCFQAVWFASTSPEGPWEVVEKVPDEIYTIPVSSPMHHTTYVQVYDSTPGYVTFGYTSGYWGMYYGWGCIMYGSGWYYPPYYYYGGLYPHYYPYPYSYGMGAYYSVYTGTYGRGAALYGPYGGAGRASYYNPTTGAYARGAAAWGPYQASTFAAAYNPRTGISARTRQGTDVYSNWGTTAVRRGDDWVRSARYSDSRGSVGAIRTSEGRQAAIGRTTSGDLYAGNDGNVYRRNDGVWQKHENGQWNNTPQQPDRRTGDRSFDSSQLSRERLGNRGGAAGGRTGINRTTDLGTIPELDRDARSRTRGDSRLDQYGRWDGSGRPSRAYGGSIGISLRGSRGSFSGGGGFRR